MPESASAGYKNIMSYTIGKITYIIKSQSGENSKQTLKEKIESLIEKDAAKTPQ